MAGGPNQTDVGGHSGRDVTVPLSRGEGQAEQISIGGHGGKGMEGIEEKPQPQVRNTDTYGEGMVEGLLLTRAVGACSITAVWV